MFEVWVTISKRNFGFERRLAELRGRYVSTVRINVRREDEAWVRGVVPQLRELGWPGSGILLDVGNHKARIRNDTVPWIDLVEGRTVEVNLLFGGEPEEGWFIREGELLASVEPGESLVVGDGDLDLEVVTRVGRRIEAVSRGVGRLASGASLSVRDGRVGHFEVSCSEGSLLRDLSGLGGIGAMLSFAESREAIEGFRREFPEVSRVVPKIESGVGLREMRSVGSVADALVLGRGDLGLDVGVEGVAGAQSLALKMARACGFDLFVATEVLSSLGWRARPLRAEVIDIGNAYSSGAAGILLTAETAAGPRPLEAVDWIRRIVSSMESSGVRVG